MSYQVGSKPAVHLPKDTIRNLFCHKVANNCSKVLLKHKQPVPLLPRMCFLGVTDGAAPGDMHLYIIPVGKFIVSHAGPPAIKASLTAPLANRFLTSRAHQGICLLNYVSIA